MNSAMGERVRQRREQLGMTQQELATRVGCSQPMIKKIEAGSRTSLGRKLANALGVTLDWLETGVSEVSALTPGGQPQPDEAVYGKSKSIYVRPIAVYNSLEELPKETTVLITRVDVAFSAGKGKEAWHVEEKEPLPFQADYIRRLDAKPANLVAVKVKGNSMEPRLFDDDTVVVDRADRRIPAGGGVFALVYSGEMLVKRLFRLPDGTIRVVSDNKEQHAPFDVPPDKLEHIDVVGRVKYRSGRGDF
ncbi:XRE family transcriptional regulator [Burkholderia multivorans]|uniref:XRE family transcriptional regulator n=1 Tax=Burkholderia multivorans TaxID=87883 RepID=UPI000CFE52D0|nr:S24 family peptidase [Burkholderia multivorans]PRG29274.1 hypothetical protein C6T62_24305 [Burkholderia multivorans]